MNDKSNYAVSVLGKLDVERLGVTYSHEHLLVKPNINDKKYYDYTLDNIDKSISEVFSFKNSGGNTVVEMTPINYGRNPLGYARISRETGINIICCTGFHKKEFLPDFVYNLNDEDIFDILLKEVNEGIDGTDVRPGVLKIGTSYNIIYNIEKRLISIVAKVHKSTGLPVSTHCDKGTMGIQQANLLIKQGVPPERIILGHVDIPRNLEYLVELCRMGVNIQIDHVGRELDNGDQFRIDMIDTLIKNGFDNQIFISGDMGKKSYFKSYEGEPGLCYIVEAFRKKLISKIGEDKYNKILIENPKRLFEVKNNL